MKIKMLVYVLGILTACCLLRQESWAGDGKSKKKFGVYEYVVQSAQGSFEEIAQTLEKSAAEQGWQVLAQIDAGVPEACSYRARVLVLLQPAYAQAIMAANRETGPFGVVDRVNIFEDEKGLHVAVVNPHSINRTILMNDAAFAEMSEQHLLALRQMILVAVQGTESHEQFGPVRDEGHIGKTMGVMAGGAFVDKIVDEAVIPAGNFEQVVNMVRKGLSVPSPKWGMHLVYETALPEYETVVFGTTGTPMDSKSFSIVKAGGSDARKGFKCPGLAHAAAYPIEVVVTKQGADVKVRLVHIMFRMKMYFEDAGKWAFMKNMGMPGSMQDEIKAQINSGLATN
ncbi:hypothetical protein EDS67_02745 [candidate division KSB1 bacterium]|nr:MAG: hypothetical protein EDS67_02745 [candidate division KSB1 bacterium]MCE7941949.1 hypothetical protein [Chlorobi bacterium CHB1]MDL1879156.1 hypothetical protein [Cytophagia bacterium CHB2]